MKTFDPFSKQKKDAFLNSLALIVFLGEHVMQLLQMKNLSQVEMKEELLRLVKVTFIHHLTLCIQSFIPASGLQCHVAY
jgi:hypothetical protein